jgi:hypothetical protein
VVEKDILVYHIGVSTLLAENIATTNLESKPRFLGNKFSTIRNSTGGEPTADNLLAALSAK